MGEPILFSTTTSPVLSPIDVLRGRRSEVNRGLALRTNLRASGSTNWFSQATFRRKEAEVATNT